VLRRLADAPDRDAVLALLVEEVPRLLGVGRLALYEAEDCDLLLSAQTPGADAPPRLELRPDEQGDLVLAATPPGVGSLLIPALAQGRLVGVLALERGPDGPPRGEDRELLEAVATHVGSALYLRERAQALESALRDLREVQAELMRVERVAVVGKLAFDVSHDLKNRLASMTFGVQNVRDAAGSGPVPPAVAAALDALVADIRRMRDRVEGFAALARDQEDRAEPCRVDLLVAEVLDRFRLDPRPVALERDAAPATARVDREQLYSAVANLVVNAYEALEHTPGAAVRVSVAARDRRVVITVADNGPGVPPGIRDKVFDAFFSTKPKGAGLGLSQVFVLAEMSGGRAYLADSPCGARFVIELPEATP
jgi:signal transduction histidine kinase